MQLRRCDAYRISVRQSDKKKARDPEMSQAKAKKILRLQKELKRVNERRDNLKKAAAYFPSLGLPSSSGCS